MGWLLLKEQAPYEPPPGDFDFALAGASDSGTSSSDGITNITLPNFTFSGITLVEGGHFILLNGVSVIFDHVVTDVEAEIGDVYPEETDLADGTYSLSVNWTAPGVDVVSNTITVVIDQTPPTITSDLTPIMEAGETLDLTLTANETSTWTITGGADQALFDITGSLLTIDDTSGVGTFEVEVTATDTAGNTTAETVSVNVGFSEAAETTAWANAVIGIGGSVSTGMRNAVNTFIATNKLAGYWSNFAFGLLWMPETSSKQHLIDFVTLANITAQFDTGMTIHAKSDIQAIAYSSTNKATHLAFNPQASACDYTLGSASYFVANKATSAQYWNMMGHTDGTGTALNPATYTGINMVASHATLTLNDYVDGASNTGPPGIGNGGDPSGIWSANRSATSGTNCRFNARDGVAFEEGNWIAGSSMPNTGFGLGGGFSINHTTYNGMFADEAKIQFALWGGSFTKAQHLAIVQSIQALIDTVEAL